MMQFDWTPIPVVNMLCVSLITNTIGAGNLNIIVYHRPNDWSLS